MAAFLADVAGPVERPAAVRQRLVDLAHMGAPDVLATSQVTARITGRMADRGATAGALAAGLRELRGIVEGLDPPDPERLDAYADRYARSRDRLDAVLGTLGEDLDALGLGMAEREQDERSLEMEVASLRRYAVMAGRLDEALEARLVELADTDPSRARRLRDDVLAPVRSRHRDLLLHLEVAMQSLLGLGALAAHDETLREAVSIARAMTVAALDAAALVARMAAERRRRAELAAAVEELRRSWQSASEALERVDRAVP